MANTLRFKRGLASGLPTGLAGEPLFTTDTFDLYIGNGTGNTRFQKFIASGTTSQLLRGDGSLLTMPIVLTSPSNGQVLKYNGTSWVNDSDAGITGSGASGQVAYFTGATTQGGSNNLFWDSTNSRLGIGTNVPDNRLQVVTNGTKSTIAIGNQLSGTYPQLLLYGGLNKYNWSVGAQYNVNNAFEITPSTAIDGTTFSTPAITIFSNGNFGVNRTTDNGLRFQVTGDGYFSGSVGIGSSSLAGVNLYLAKTITGSGFGYGILQSGVIQSNVTSFSMGFYNQLLTQAASFTLNNYYHYFAQQSTLGAGSAVTNQYGYFIDSTLTGATNNYGFYGNIASGTGRWNLYMNGTAANYLNGNLGVGVLPSVWETVTKAIQVGTTGSISSNTSDYRTTIGANTFINSAGTATYLVTAAATQYMQISGTHRWFYAASGTAGNSITFTEGMRLDASGNLGLGVTPSTWAASRSKIEFSSAGTTAGFVGCFAGSSANNQMGLGSNAYYNASAVWTYSNTGGGAGYYAVKNNVHEWHIAPSGTAGNAITFTQAMTLDASGNLAIGMTSVPNDAKVAIKSTGSRPASIKFHNASTGDTDTDGFYVGLGGSDGLQAYVFQRENSQLIFATNATESMRIHTDGNLAIGTTSNAGYKLDVNGTMRVSGASTFSSSVTLSSTSSFVVLDNTTPTTGKQWRVSSGNNGNFFVTHVGVVDALTIAQTTGAATFSSSVTANGGASGVGLYVSNNTNSRQIQLGYTSGAAYNYIQTYDGTNFHPLMLNNSIWIAANGNVLVGTTTDAGYKLDVNGTMRVSGASTLSGAVTMNASVSGNNPILELSNSNTLALEFTDLGQAANNRKWQFNANSGVFYFRAFNDARSSFTEIMQFTRTGAATFSSSVTAASFNGTSANVFSVGGTEGMRLTSALNLGLGTTNPLAKLHINNASSAATAFLAGNNAGGAYFGWDADSTTFIGSYLSSSAIKFGFNYSSGTLTEGMRLTTTGLGIGMTPSYKLDVTGSARISDAIAIGTTPDTNLPFKILKNINSTVGIRFENTSTGASSFTGYQFGTDVSGGTAFTNFLYASSGVAETGVYKPNGTALINTGSGGLNFLAVSQPIRFFTSTGNGTLRAAITNDGDFTQYNGTNPSASTTDAFRMYSADITAGNAAPHFRTENGGIIKLYQQTTGVTSATYIGGAGTGLTDSDTFDGYTIAQIVKALRNAGLLA